MKNFERTKGKWELEKNSVNAYNLLSGEGWKGDYIAIINSPSVVISQKVADANALLISKAPEMLEMLEYAMVILGNLGEIGIAKKIEQLIKEATEL